MCIGIPMQVLNFESNRALCTDGVQEHWVDMSLVGEQVAETWVLVFLGAAREVITPQRAEHMKKALTAVAAVMNGNEVNIDELFADLTEREPTLPAHLQPNLHK